ncbi:PIN domain-containing protein [Streptomyces sp. NPDC051098]|uniref:PIN domain-containing protein n=1 Tax=Streptomyces sp. NPDC051098 TaxID=3155411 RepID=UPI003419487F
MPWMVLEELVAKRTLEYAAAHARASAAVKSLDKTTPWGSATAPSPYDAEHARTYWRQQYSSIFEVIETSGETARQALFREANCEKPANGPDSKDKGGARDAAIWLSVVDYLRANPEASVWFVSDNTSDFGDGTAYPSPMVSDIRGMEHRLTHLTSFDDVVKTFAEPLDIDERHVEAALTELLSESARPIETAATDLLNGNWHNGTKAESLLIQGVPNAPCEPSRWFAWLNPPNASLLGVADAVGYEIDGEKWYTATVDWLLLGISAISPDVLIPTACASELTVCQWRTKLLFSTRNGDTPTVLEWEPPQSLDPAEREAWQPLLVQPHNAIAAVGILAAALVEYWVQRKETPNLGFKFGETHRG